MNLQRIPILMYHSISNATGPTSLSPEIFAAHMQAVAQANWSVISLDTFVKWHRGEITLTNPSLVITFDDGFDDFRQNAYPVLKTHNFAATVFIPTQRMGNPEAWAGANQPARELMSWQQVTKLSQEGISFAPHSRNHANLSRLGGQALKDEIVGAFSDLRIQLPQAPAHFAPPYGAISPTALELIRQTYEASVGVRLDIADRHSPLHDLPRLEMFYYSDPSRFAQLLAGRGQVYLYFRKFARSVRRLAPHIPQKAYA